MKCRYSCKCCSWKCWFKPDTYKQLNAEKTIAIANKETLVTAGHLVMEAAERNNVSLFQ